MVLFFNSCGIPSIFTFASQFFKVLPCPLETVHDLRRKSAAFSCNDHLKSFVLWECLLIYSFMYQRIINIRNRHNLCRNRNFIPLKTVRITPSVIAFMMVAADFMACSSILLIPYIMNMVQNITALCGMGLHIFKLFSGQLAGLEQNGVRNCNFSDIMKCAG